MEFDVVIRKDQDGYFVASVPSLPGCHTQARSLEELEPRIEEAVALCLDAWGREAGQALILIWEEVKAKDRIIHILWKPNTEFYMFAEYVQAALEKAQYKIIDNGEEPYFVDVPELDGVWATGKTVEDARRDFIEALEDWIAAHLLWNLALPPIGGHSTNPANSI